MIVLTATTTPYSVSDALIAQNADVTQLALEPIKVVNPTKNAIEVDLPLTTFGANTQTLSVLVVNSGGGTTTVLGTTPSGGSQETINGSTGAYSVTQAANLQIGTTGAWVAFQAA